jgi:hypothetical protein
MTPETTDPWIEADAILHKATRIARNNDSPEQEHRTRMFHCWRDTLRLEKELGWEPSPSVLTALQTVPPDIRDDSDAPAPVEPHRRTHGELRKRWWSAESPPTTKYDWYGQKAACRVCSQPYQKHQSYGLSDTCDDCDPNIPEQIPCHFCGSYIVDPVTGNCRPCEVAKSLKGDGHNYAVAAKPREDIDMGQPYTDVTPSEATMLGLPIPDQGWQLASEVRPAVRRAPVNKRRY